jgi:hypothetical protein
MLKERSTFAQILRPSIKYKVCCRREAASAFLPIIQLEEIIYENP